MRESLRERPVPERTRAFELGPPLTDGGDDDLGELHTCSLRLKATRAATLGCPPLVVATRRLR
jgi:hypothetical protein